MAAPAYLQQRLISNMSPTEIQAFIKEQKELLNEAQKVQKAQIVQHCGDWFCSTLGGQTERGVELLESIPVVAAEDIGITSPGEKYLNKQVTILDMEDCPSIVRGVISLPPLGDGPTRTRAFLAMKVEYSFQKDPDDSSTIKTSRYVELVFQRYSSAMFPSNYVPAMDRITEEGKKTSSNIGHTSGLTDEDVKVIARLLQGEIVELPCTSPGLQGCKRTIHII